MTNYRCYIIPVMWTKINISVIFKKTQNIVDDIRVISIDIEKQEMRMIPCIFRKIWKISEKGPAIYGKCKENRFYGKGRWRKKEGFWRKTCKIFQKSVIQYKQEREKTKKAEWSAEKDCFVDRNHLKVQFLTYEEFKPIRQAYQRKEEINYGICSYNPCDINALDIEEIRKITFSGGRLSCPPLL